MAMNLGTQTASIVDDKIREFRTLQEELNDHHSNLGTLMAQRNENEMVKQVRKWCLPAPDQPVATFAQILFSPLK